MAHSWIVVGLLASLDGQETVDGGVPGAASPDIPEHPPVATGVPPSNGRRSELGFFGRLGQAYWQDWTGTLPAGPEAVFRGDPPPVSSPPFPWDYWPYGGSPTIGAANASWTPLMAALEDGPSGDFWRDTGLRIYGWVAGGFNVSTSKSSGFSNAPAAYYALPNTWRFDVRD
jgi:hypothetical protein